MEPIGMFIMAIIGALSSYSIYSMWTSGSASNWKGIGISSVTGFFSATLEGYARVGECFVATINGTAATGMLIYVVGICIFIIVLVLNMLTTGGRTLVK